MEPGALLESFVEARLLARVAKKDAAAFAEFYDRTSPVLFSVARSILLDDAPAEDVLQEVYLQIWEKAEVFDPALGKPISWAIALTRNKAFDRLRASKRRESALQAFAVEPERAASVPASADVEMKEVTELVKKALSGFSDGQRQALELWLFQGLPHAQVAALMKEPLGTVKAWIRRGIIEIRQQMKGQL